MALKKWILPRENPALAAVLAKECGVNQLVASILVNRGRSSAADARQFLSRDMTIGSPFDIADMKLAADRIHQAVDTGEAIAIYGDYDCDGITSTAILYTYLQSLGAEVSYYIPEREGDGYGLNLNVIDRFFNEGVSLIITVDNGISAIEEIQYANNLGMEVVVTDHHQSGNTLPAAYAVVDPHRKEDNSSFKDLCGAGVVSKLLIAMESDLSFVMENYADLIAVGTIGDIVPLVDENRALVKYGIDMLRSTNNIGLMALIAEAGIDPQTITAQQVAFGLVPRINAAGRMGSASLAMELLLSEDEDQARLLATKLGDMNAKRQALEVEILAEIDQMLADNPQLLHRRVLTLYSETWNHGVIGILCSRLIERYGKPVLLMTRDGDCYKGSARSLGEFHLFKALNAASTLLTRFGGHKLAAGFTVHQDDLADFINAIETYAEEQFDIMPAPVLMVDKVLTARDMTLESVAGLEALKPYGAINEEPRFMLRQAVVTAVEPTAKGNHLRLTIDIGDMVIKAMWFNVSELPFRIGEHIDCIVSVEVNSYNGRDSVSVKIREARTSTFTDGQSKYFAAAQYYDKLWRGEQVEGKIVDHSIPNRDEIAVIHKWLIQHGGFAGDVDQLYMRIMAIAHPAASTKPININYCKLRLVLDILADRKLIAFAFPTAGITVLTPDGKINLNDAEILLRLGKTVM